MRVLDDAELRGPRGRHPSVSAFGAPGAQWTGKGDPAARARGQHAFSQTLVRGSDDDDIDAKEQSAPNNDTTTNADDKRMP